MKQHTSLKVPFFINIFFVCNPKLCINQALKATKSDLFDLFDFFYFFFSDSVSKSLKVT